MNQKIGVRREPLTDTQLLMTITIFIFFGMYLLAMLLFILFQKSMLFCVPVGEYPKNINS